MSMHQSQQRNVWLTSSRITRPRFVGTAIEQRGIFPKPNCASIMETRNQTNPICVSGPRLWDQIPEKGRSDHLIQMLKKYFNVSVDLEGKEFMKIQLDWDYENRKVHLSMASYLQKALRQFDNIIPSKCQDSPYPYTEQKYGTKQQFAEYDTSAPVGNDEQKYVQKVTGKFNWYARGVDSTMLTPISALSAQQAKPTQATMRRVQHFLDYAATKESAVTTYRTSDMVLAIHSDAGYLNEEGARSRAGGHHFLSENIDSPSNNVAIYNEALIIKAVMSSAAEAEIGALYTNARKGVEERNILRVMGHPQPPTPVQTDNSTAEGIINLRVQPKRTKAMDM